MLEKESEKIKSSKKRELTNKNIFQETDVNKKRVKMYKKDNSKSRTPPPKKNMSHLKYVSLATCNFSEHLKCLPTILSAVKVIKD